MRIVHHDLSLRLSPESGDLSAVDRLYLSGDDNELKVYLGSAFRLKEARQGERQLTTELLGEERRQRHYVLRGWNPASPEVTLEWAGHVGNFEISGVCAITPQLVELSGFGSWFPTVEASNEEESFSYRLDIDLPAGWEIVSPGISDHGDTSRRHFEHQRPIEDIFICAAPRFECSEAVAGGQHLRVYSTGLDEAVRRGVCEDFQRVVDVVSRHLGPMLPGRGGVAVISPRGESGQEWGFERGDLWVVGDTLANLLVRANWRPEFVPGAASLSLHETIHAWLGLGLQFTQPWLAEASTQYYEMALSEERFDQPGNAETFFASYVPRIMTTLAKDDRTIASMDHSNSTYVHWYLKGSWAFWDLDAVVGRQALVDAIAAIYRHHAGGTIDYDTYIAEMSELLQRPLAGHFRHWFLESGFSPRYRS